MALVYFSLMTNKTAYLYMLIYCGMSSLSEFFSNHLSIFKLRINYFMCMGICLSVYLCTVRVHCPKRSEEGVRSLGTGVTDGCELPCGCWESNRSSGGTMLLTAEPSFQPLVYLSYGASDIFQINCQLIMQVCSSTLLFAFSII